MTRPLGGAVHWMTRDILRPLNILFLLLLHRQYKASSSSCVSLTALTGKMAKGNNTSSLCYEFPNALKGGVLDQWNFTFLRCHSGITLFILMVTVPFTAGPESLKK